ncbi:MAG: cation:proton antiporter [Bacteroidota bacterium]
MIELLWICAAFALGFVARQMHLPPLIGYLVTGFLLYTVGFVNGPIIQQFADLGVTLLLFTIGLKLRIRGLLRPHVWGVGVVHMGLVTVLIGLALFGLSVVLPGIALLGDFTISTALLLGFALSYSSTVFAVKVLEDKGEMGTIYGQAAIGILIIQDLVAVVFLAVSAGKTPTLWAPLLLAALVPLRWVLLRIMHRAGHEELLILFGLSLAVGSYEGFELVGIKGDLGALIVGAMLAGDAKAGELARRLLGFKDFFLVGFFISIGLNGIPTAEAILVAVLLVVLVPVKSLLFFDLFTRFRLRSRSSFLATLSLSNYSEFGLIIAVVAVSAGWVAEAWLLTIALALALSFVLAAPLNLTAHALYDRLHEWLNRFQRPTRLPEEEEVVIGDATVLVFGMGRVGSGAYDYLQGHSQERVLGLDMDGTTVAQQQEQGRAAIQASALDSDFWDRLQLDRSAVHLVMLAMPQLEENLFAAEKLSSLGYGGRIAAIVKYGEDRDALQDAGVDHIYNFYTEAGAGFAADAFEALAT